MHAWAVPLVAWNLSSQKRSSPFLARANTPYLFCFILISWWCLTSPTFSFHNEPIDWPIAKGWKTMEGPQNRRFYGKMEYLPFWPTYIGEKGRTLGQTYRIKVRCYREHPWGTHWEHEGNMVGTKEKRKKFSPHTKLKRKKSRHFGCMLSPPIGCMKFLFPNLFVIFGLG